MTHAQFLRIKKLTGKAIIEVAARHNCREILAELGAEQGGDIDPARVGLNRVLRGLSTAASVARQAQTLMDDAGVKPVRKDAVRALEIIFGLPPDSSIDQDRFFNESVQWADQYFAVPVISAIVHNDESAPHCHVLLLPLVDGRMVGSDLMGGRTKLQAMHADFHAQIGQRHGLTRQTPQKRPSAATRKQAIDSAFDVLEANGGLSDAVLHALLGPHMGDPAPLLLALGLTMPTPTAIKGDFTKMMTKPCKPEKPIGFSKKKPIGFNDCPAPKNHQTLSCVGFAISPPSFPPPDEPQTSASQDDHPKHATTSSAVSAEPEPIHTGDEETRQRDDTQLQPPLTTDARATTTGQIDPARHIAADYPSVPSSPLASHEHDHDRDPGGDSYDRVSDSQPSGQWNTDTGEWMPPERARTSRKELIATSVSSALARIGKTPGGAHILAGVDAPP